VARLAIIGLNEKFTKMLTKVSRIGF